MKRNKSLSSEKEATGIDPGNLLLIIYMLFVAMLLLFGGVGFSQAGEVSEEQKIVTLDDVKQGELLVSIDGAGRYSPLPMLDQKVEIDVSGMIVRTKVKQSFFNPGDGWIEATYVFPLPEDSGVDTLTMVVGERRINGIIKEKAEARKIYEKAKSEGKKTSLLVQRRPNIFQTAVANIGPKEKVSVEIEYQQKVMYADNIFSLRFPMAITPRYQPFTKRQEGELSSASSLSFSDNGWLSEVLDSQHSREEKVQKANVPVQLVVRLDSGFPLSRVDSLYHGVNISKNGEVQILEFTGETVADRDFVLEWETTPSNTIQAALFTETVENDKYTMLMVMPPHAGKIEQVMPREVTFILDTSGSMGGLSIRQAKKSLRYAVSRLHPLDTFNVIEFNSSARALFNSAQPASAENLSNADRFVEKLRADGGTEMRSALELGLKGTTSEDRGRIQQIVFITDGAVTNEQELFSYISNNLGAARLFTIGIGSAPNSYFMTRAARAGRGTFTYIGKAEEITEKMNTLLQKLTSPAAHDIRIASEFEGGEIYPNPVPDLYSGEPLLVTMRMPGDMKELKVEGMVGMQRFQYDLDVGNGKENSGISKLWARDKIRQHMEGLVFGEPEAQVREKVLKTALKFGLVSKYTSLVAVEEKISRPPESALKSSSAKGHLPHGSKAPSMSGQQLYAGGPKTATASSMLIRLSVICLIVSMSMYILSRRRQ